MAGRRHVFISHHHADDAHVSRLTESLARRGYEIRNSSIRAKPENQRRLEEKRVSDRTLKRLLRMKMNWASTVIVLIGKETHARPWVDWEIRQAHEMGKRIIGVHTRGSTDAEVPEALEDYGVTIRNWNPESIIDAVEGGTDFLTAGGRPRNPVHAAATSRC